MLDGEFPVWINILLLLAGLAIITKGAGKFVDSAVVIAEKTRVSKAIIGATIVSLGTTLPEFSVAALGGVFERSQTAIGGAIGSTICNIGLVLGSCVLIRPIVGQRKLYWQQGVMMVLAGVLVVLLSLDGNLSRGDALILTAGLAGYIYFSFNRGRADRKDAENSVKDVKPVLEVEADQTYRLGRMVVWFILGAIAVGLGAMLTVQNAVIVANWLGIPELVIGLTVVALGTSLPEYVTSLTATIKGYGEIAVGNIIGADTLDILFVLGPGVLSFSRLPVERQTMTLDYPIMLILMMLVVFLGIIGHHLVRWQGGMLLGIYVIYLIMMFLWFVR